MSVNVDLLGNIITPPEASPTKDAKKVYIPPAADSGSTSTQSDAERVVSYETVGITANYIATYETFIAGPNLNSVATADFNFLERHHDCKMSQSAVKNIKKATSLICYISRRDAFKTERDRIINGKIVHSGCTTKRVAEVRRTIRKEYKKISEQARRNVSGGYNSKGEWIDGKHLCTFVTLTLPAEQRHSDREICSQLINPFFVWARKQKGVRYYIWKKELQANGNLHYHIIWDKAVNWQDIRNEWNKLCNKGYVRGIAHPFDYVDRYCARWSEVHKDGFNREYVTEYVSTLPSTDVEIKQAMEAWEKTNGRRISTPEFDSLRQTIIDGIVAEYQTAYEKELKKADDNKFYKLWTDPNSTDIRAVKSPRMVAFYMSKYIAKEIEDNPALTNYKTDIENIKREMSEWQKVIKELQKAGKDFSDALDCWQKKKDELDEYRNENCPIQGRMWFKSQSLTVFMKGIPEKSPDGKTTYTNGARQEMDEFYLAELIDLQNYLHSEETRINKERLEKAYVAAARGDKERAEKLKEPISLVLERYDTTLSFAQLTAQIVKCAAGDDAATAAAISEPVQDALIHFGTRINRKQLAEQIAVVASQNDYKRAEILTTPIFSILERNSKVICKTLIISVFELQFMKTDAGTPRFLHLSRAWNRYMTSCYDYNENQHILARQSEPKAAFVSLKDRATYTPDGIYPHVYSVCGLPFEYCKIESGNYNVTFEDADFYLQCSIPDLCSRGKAIAAYLKAEIKTAIRNRKDGIIADPDAQRLHEYLLTKIQ